MAADGRLYDTQTLFVAQDAETDPSYLPDSYVSDSVNRQFRGGKNQTRPPFVERLWVVSASEENPSELSDIINYGNFQGCKEYRAVKVGSFDGFVTSIAGNIIFFAANGNYFVAYRLWSGNDPLLMHAWFCQAEDQFYIQNGKDLPLVWDGIPDNPCVELNPYNLQMPVGTLMAYAHGRVFVSTIYDQIYASDNIFGAGFTTTTNTRNFTEQQYWQEGGAFSLLANMGRITGMLVLPSININSRGQGELVVFSQAGATSFDVSGVRATWIDTNIQKLTLIGRGCASPWSLAAINGQVFYRAYDGWAFFSNSQSEFQSSLSYQKISTEVDPYVREDSSELIQFESAAYFDNRILGQVSPMYEVGDEGFGMHRFSRGLVVADVNTSQSASPDAGLNFRWNGVWTGPRPCQIFTMFYGTEKKCYTWSYGEDGKNRIYELSKIQGDDYVDGRNIKIRGSFVTKRFDWSGSQATNKFYRKKLNGGDMWLSGFSGAITTQALYRPDTYPCWNEISPEITTYCDNCTPNLEDCKVKTSQRQMRRIKFTTPAEGCQVNQDIKTADGAEFQFKVNLVGVVRVDRIRGSIAKPDNEDAPMGDCGNEGDFTCKQITCCSEDSFSYSIA